VELIRPWVAKRQDDSEARRLRKFLSTSLVVFHCTQEQAASINVAVGPCVPRVGPRGGRLRPLASPFAQMHSDTFTHLGALYTVLTSRPGEEAVEDVERQGPGTLARLAKRFATGLTELGTIHTDVESALAAQRGIAARWFATVHWSSPTMKVGGVEMRVLSFAATARLAQQKGHPVYCWHGPAVPTYVIAQGVGQDSYEAYRRAKR
jgi:hypothetical protein